MAMYLCLCLPHPFIARRNDFYSCDSSSCNGAFRQERERERERERDHFYGAMLLRVWYCYGKSSVRLSVRPSVTLRYRGLEYFENSFMSEAWLHSAVRNIVDVSDVPGLILSVQSNQFVQSKTQIVQSNTRNCAVQNLHDGCKTNRRHYVNAKSFASGKVLQVDIGEHDTPIREKVAGKF